MRHYSGQVVLTPGPKTVKVLFQEHAIYIWPSVSLQTLLFVNMGADAATWPTNFTHHK
jgi:hypothetical protein